MLVALDLECHQLLMVLPQQLDGSLLLLLLELTVVVLLQRHQCGPCYAPYLRLPALVGMVAHARVCCRCTLSCLW